MTSYARYPSLRGRRVLISGGATGIGAELVSQFAAQGAHVVFIDLQTEAGEDLAAGLASTASKAGGATPVFRTADVTDLDSYPALITDEINRGGAFSVLINNAANDVRHSLEEVTPESWRRGMQINLDHHFFAARAVAGPMAALGGGSIINLGSISPYIGAADLAIYRTAKVAIEGLSRMLAEQLGPQRIRVNCLLPGWVMTQKQLDLWVDDAAKAEIEAAQCVPDSVLPADIARMALWLAADDSRACTGQNWIVDGGWIS